MLCIVPSCVLWNWATEIERWSPWRIPAVVGASRDAHRIRTNECVVTTHSLLLREPVLQAIVSQDWDVCLVDESHFFRGRTAVRTANLWGIGEIGGVPVSNVTERMWVLSGTPMPNDPSDLWTMCHGMQPAEFPESFADFRAEYCVTGWKPYGDGVKVLGSRNVPALRERLKPWCLRRRKDDVLSLPPVRYETIALRPDKLPRDIPLVAQELDPATLLALTEIGEAEAGFEALGKRKAFAAFRRLCGLAKAEATAKLVDFELGADLLDKVVLFAHHTDVVNALASTLERHGVVTITGATTAKAREKAVRAFQHNSAVRVIVCNILAGGTGTTLTKAANVLFVEMSYVPGENSQAADRIRRIGQTRDCRVRFVSLAGTLDESLVRVLLRKSQMIHEVIN